MQVEVCEASKLATDKDLVPPDPEPEHLLHQLRREATLLYPIPQVEVIPEIMGIPRTVREVEVPLATNVISPIRKPATGGVFEL